MHLIASPLRVVASVKSRGLGSESLSVEISLPALTSDLTLKVKSLNAPNDKSSAPQLGAQCCTLGLSTAHS